MKTRQEFHTERKRAKRIVQLVITLVAAVIIGSEFGWRVGVTVLLVVDVLTPSCVEE